MNAPGRFLAASAAAALASCLAAAGSVGASTAAEPSPQTHKVMVFGPFPGPNFSFPGMKSGLEAAVAYFNENGGFGTNHDQLEALACNTQADPNVEADCVREAVDEGVIAIVGGFTLTPNVATPVLAEANIPWLAYTASAPDQFAAPTGFPLVVGNALYVGAGAAATADGCERPVILSLAIPASQYFDPAIEAGIAQEGGESAGTISIPATATDFAPSIAQALDAEADCIIANVPPNLATPFMSAVKSSGADLPVYGNSGVFTPDQVAADPDLFTNVTTTAMTPAMADSPDIEEFEAAVSAYEPDDYAVDSLNYLQEWIGIKMLQQAAAELDDISAESLLEAMRTTTFDLGFDYEPMEFSTPVNDTTYRGVYRTEVFLMQLVDGQFDVVDTLDTREGLLALD